MHQQPDINAKMRCILIDWIVEVHYKFKLTHQSLFLCVNIIDRYLQDVRIARGKLQLVGVTALLIACKYEETRVPEIQDCVSITDEAYSREDILEMEVMILTQLKFQLTVPTPFHFMARYLEIASASDVMRHVAAYYSDRNLLEHCMLAYDPSQFASAVVYSALSYMHQFDESFQKSPAARDGRWVSIHQWIFLRNLTSMRSLRLWRLSLDSRRWN
jgi:cyclin B